MDKKTVDRRCDLMRQEGIEFRCGTNVGVDVTTEELREQFDAILICTGATKARDTDVPGRDLTGINYAMSYLPQQTKLNLGDQIFEEQMIDAKDKHVIIIGGGDTAADCLGTALRQGAASIVQFDINKMPPGERDPDKTWPHWPMVLRTSAAHEEGLGKYGKDLRDYAVITKAFEGDDAGHVRKLKGVRINSHKDETGRRHIEEIEGSEFELPCDLCLLAIGFSGPETYGPVADLGIELTGRGAIQVNDHYETNVEGVYAAGDSRRGQSLVVWAISEGRQAARCIDEALMGRTDLPYLPVEL
jgi:glutamate synthase (NADPH/NADH) small chain